MYDMIAWTKVISLSHHCVLALVVITTNKKTKSDIFCSWIAGLSGTQAKLTS